MDIMRDEIKTTYIPEGKVSYLCVIPDDYVRVLYWLHGFRGNENELAFGLAEYEGVNTERFEEAEKFLREFAGRFRTAIVMPSLGNHYYLDAKWKNRYIGRFIAEELVPVTRERYSFPEGKGEIYIGGASMGGFGALLQGFRHPDLFGGVIAISAPLILEGATEENPDPKVWCGLPSNYFTNLFGEDFLNNPEVNPERAAELVNKDECPEIYMACSTNDPPINKYNLKNFQKWKAADFPITGMETERAQNMSEGHNWRYFAAEVHKAMEYLTGRK